MHIGCQLKKKLNVIEQVAYCCIIITIRLKCKLYTLNSILKTQSLHWLKNALAYTPVEQEPHILKSWPWAPERDVLRRVFPSSIIAIHINGRHCGFSLSGYTILGIDQGNVILIDANGALLSVQGTSHVSNPLWQQYSARDAVSD